MKGSSILVLFCSLAFLAVSVAIAAEGVPKMTSATPDTGKIGAVITVEGEFLDKAHVAEVYLTDGQKDWKVEIVKQEDKVIQFKIPANAKVGRFSLMVLTRGAEPKLIEEPVRVTVEGEGTSPSS